MTSTSPASAHADGGSKRSEERDYTIMPTVTNPKTQQWLDALRSGRYTQTVHCLQNKITGGMCCLGVAEKEIWGTEFVNSDDASEPDHLGIVEQGDFKQILFTEHQLDLDLTDLDVETLTSLNDDDDFDFEMIANVVERAHTHQVSIGQAAWDIYQRGDEDPSEYEDWEL